MTVLCSQGVYLVLRASDRTQFGGESDAEIEASSLDLRWQGGREVLTSVCRLELLLPRV